MPVCLQGGEEFREDCLPMDRAVLARAGRGTVVVAGYARTPGPERDRAFAAAYRHYRRLGAPEVVPAGDERGDAALLSSAALLVLPDGNAARLLRALAPHAAALRSASRLGAMISGSGAGAMVLCAWVLLPGSGRPRIVPGLGLVENALAIPSYGLEVDMPADSEDSLPPDTLVLGIPRRSGLLVDDTGLTAMGRASSALIGARHRMLAVGSRVPF